MPDATGSLSSSGGAPQSKEPAGLVWNHGVGGRRIECGPGTQNSRSRFQGASAPTEHDPSRFAREGERKRRRSGSASQKMENDLFGTQRFVVDGRFIDISFEEVIPRAFTGPAPDAKQTLIVH